MRLIKNKNKPSLRIHILNQEEEIYKGKLMHYPFKEKVILKYSKEYFNDSNPCYMHRSAVLSRILLSFEDYVQQQEHTVAVEGLPPQLRNFLPELKNHYSLHFFYQ